MTRYLLDTHTLIWWWLSDPMLSKRARALLEAGDGVMHVSSISGYEIALKVRAGQLPEMAETLQNFHDALLAEAFVELPIFLQHTIDAGLLQGKHRDPFDRMIAAQALSESLIVVTRDPRIADFGCKVLW